MSRVYVSDDCSTHELWIANARRAIEGRRGQKFLRELERALLEMPVKRLIADAFCRDGEVCLTAAAAVQRRVDDGLDRRSAIAEIEATVATVCHNPFECDDGVGVATRLLGLTGVLAWELLYLNDGDECYGPCWTPETRYKKCLEWVQKRIKP